MTGMIKLDSFAIHVYIQGIIIPHCKWFPDYAQLSAESAAFK